MTARASLAHVRSRVTVPSIVPECMLALIHWIMYLAQKLLPAWDVACGHAGLQTAAAEPLPYRHAPLLASLAALTWADTALLDRPAWRTAHCCQQQLPLLKQLCAFLCGMRL